MVNNLYNKYFYTCSNLNIFQMNIFQIIISPLDQFEIRNLFSVDTPLLGNINLSVTNIGLYMTIAAFLTFSISILASNYSVIIPNE